MNKKRDTLSKNKVSRPFIPLLGKIDYIFILIFLFSLYYNQFVTLEKLSNIINPIAPLGTIRNFLNFLLLYGNRIFDRIDLYIFVLLIISSFYFIYKILRNKRWKQYIITSNFSHKRIMFFLFIISIISLRFYFSRGENIYWGDSSYFTSLAISFYNNFKRLNFFPYFSYVSSCGNPFYIEYPPLFSYISGLLNLIFNNIYFSIKLTMFLFHFFSVIGTYFFVYEISKSKRVAFISSISDILLYFHSHIAIYLGRYSSLAAWSFFPFILYFFEKSIKNSKLKYYILLSLSFGLLLLSNIGVAYLFIFPIGLYFFIKFILLISQKKKGAYKNILIISFFSFVGILIGSPYLYFIANLLNKYLFSGENFGIVSQIKIIKNIFPGIFLWNNYKIRMFNVFFPWQVSYWGISIILFSILGIVYLIKRRKNIELILMYFFVLFLVIGFGWFPLFKFIPYFYKYSNARFLHVLAMVTVFVSGYSYLFLSKKFNKEKMFIFIILIMFLDLFPTTFQDTFGKYYGENAYPIFQYLKKKFGYKNNKYASFRVDQIGIKSYYVNQNWRNINVGITEVSIPFSYDASRIYKPLGEFGYNFYFHHIYLLMHKQKIIESQEFFKFYYLFNTRFLISSYPLSLNKKYYRHIYRNKNIYLAEFKYYSPVFISKKILSLKNSPLTNFDFYELLNKYDIDLTKNIAKVIYVTNLLKTNLYYTNNNKLNLSLKKHIVYDDKIYLKVNVSSECFAQLSYSSYPNAKIFLNRKKINYFESPFGFIVIKLKKGDNEIVIFHKPLKILYIFIWLSRIVFITLLIFLFYSIKNRKE